MEIRGIDARRTEVTMGEWKAIIVKRVRNSGAQHWDSLTRIYGAPSTFAHDLDEKVSENVCKPVYGTGDGFANDEERDAHMKAYKTLKRQTLAKAREGLSGAIAVLHSQIGRFENDVPTVKFSAKAGCSMCPCSPGYILSTRWTLTGSPVDIWFERVEKAPTVICNCPPEGECVSHYV